MKTMNKFLCQNCNKTFEAYKQINRKYCSIACSNLGRGGAKAPNGTGNVSPFGYRYIHINGRKILEHRYVMEVVLGRKLTLKEVVHHKDGNKLNNAPDNLELLVNQAAHAKKHIKRFADDTHKECSRCEKIKARSEFNKRSKNSHNTDPNGAYCKECQSQVTKQRRQKKLGKCSDCGTDNIYLPSKGMCGACNSRRWNIANRERLNAKARMRRATRKSQSAKCHPQPLTLGG